MIKAFIVEDMPDAEAMLRQDLASHCPEVNILGSADSVITAAKWLKNNEVDILFLDIMLGDGTGFDLLEILPELNSKLIFTTASEEYAIKAFRFAAIDYLLKPIVTKELVQAVEKAKHQLPQNESIDLLKATIKNPNALPTKISLHAQDKISVVSIDEIVRCEADGNNTCFYLKQGERIFVTKTLKQFDALFSEHDFMRVHQSHLINKNEILEYVRTEGGYLKMKNGDEVPVAVRKKTAVIEMLDHL